MGTKFFHDEFIAALHRRVPRRPQLVKEVARILRIEKESASRRINGTVSFSIDETAELARELGISLDVLMHPAENIVWLPGVFEDPWRENSIETLADIIENHLDLTSGLTGPESDYGQVAGSLPFEFVIEYPELLKYFLFKWGHFFVGTDEFNDYSTWNIPSARFDRTIEKFRHQGPPACRLYILDDSLIWSVVRELEYLSAMRVIDAESKKRIRNDLHLSLSWLEEWMKGVDDDESGQQITFYISSVQIGANCWYLISENGTAAFFETHFTRTGIFTGTEACHAVRGWVNSLKKVSYLVSGSGSKERRLYFEEQHRLIDFLLDGGVLK